jgi:O-antigen ligase
MNNNQDIQVGSMILTAIAVVTFVLVISTITMLVWNSVVVSVFGLTAINFWQALGLYVLLSIVGSFFRKQ